MSTRTVHVCDVCDKDVADVQKIFGFYGVGGNHPMHVGPCCASKTIADLAAAFNRKYPTHQSSRTQAERTPA